MKRSQARRPRIVVAVNRDHEALGADPENASRADVLNVAAAVARALRGRGYTPIVVGVGDDVGAALARIRAARPAAVFNLCESLRGEGRFESVLPWLLDLHGLPYTGSDGMALGLALDKSRCKEILRARGIATPGAVRVEPGEAAPGTLAAAVAALRFPVIVKPSREDASVGITRQSVVATPRAALALARQVARRYRQPALIEEFIDGREINAAMLMEPGATPRVRSLPLSEIDFSGMPRGAPHIVSYDGKWSEGSEDYLGTPPRLASDLGPALTARVRETARAAFLAVGVRDYGRVDLRISRAGVPFVIEVNPNCDLSPGAGFARAAAAGGLAYDAVIEHIMGLALQRAGQHHAAHPNPSPSSLGSRPAVGADRSRRRKPVPARGGGVRDRAARRGSRSPER